MIFLIHKKWKRHFSLLQPRLEQRWGWMGADHLQGGERCHHTFTKKWFCHQTLLVPTRNRVYLSTAASLTEGRSPGLRMMGQLSPEPDAHQHPSHSWRVPCPSLSLGAHGGAFLTVSVPVAGTIAAQLQPGRPNKGLMAETQVPRTVWKVHFKLWHHRDINACLM